MCYISKNMFSSEMKFSMLSFYCLSVLLEIIAVSTEPPYIQGMGLTNEIDGKFGDDAAVHVYDKRLGFWSIFVSDPNTCQEEAASPYLTCDRRSPYRNIDGTCNNPWNRFYGATGECFARFIKAHYQGRGDPRLSVTGSPLPHPRQLSLNLLTDHFEPSPRDISMMFVVFGQYVAHDVSRVILEPVDGLCCESQNVNSPKCINIDVQKDDVFYSRYNITCTDMNRAVTCASCGTGKREIQNGQTADLDASITYAGQINLTNFLRAFDGTGRLKVDRTEQGDFMPAGRVPDDLFCPDRLDKQCFIGGDNRANQHSYLMSWQTIFLREHNRLARLLKQLNPEWEEEELFQEARRFVIAELQCVTYQEYLPLLLGQELMDQYRLTVGEGTEDSWFDPDFPLRTFLEFTGAAFRLHSMIGSWVGVPGLRFGSTYTYPPHLREGHMAQLMGGVCRAAAQAHGTNFAEDTTEHLYQLHDENFGQDLAANDLQRGRDLGLPPYVNMVKFCSEGWSDISSFDQLERYIPPEKIQLLKENYADVRDVDLWVGFHMETPMAGSLLGFVGSCVVGRQFRHLKDGDRFFFSHEGEAPAFTDNQRSALQQCSVSRLLCDSVDGLEVVPRNAFQLPSPRNPLVPCEQVPQLDLSFWKASFGK